MRAQTGQFLLPVPIAIGVQRRAFDDSPYRSVNEKIPAGALPLKQKRPPLGWPSLFAKILVGARGFEPPTSCSQSRRAARLRHAPQCRDSLACFGVACKPNARPARHFPPKMSDRRGRRSEKKEAAPLLSPMGWANGAADATQGPPHIGAPAPGAGPKKKTAAAPSVGPNILTRQDLSQFFLTPQTFNIIFPHCTATGILLVFLDF